MPIVDIELVCESEAEFSGVSAARLADALGAALGTAPGRTWVRLRYLSSRHYAENDSTLAGAELPAFVTVLHAHAPDAETLAGEARLITEVVARSLARAPQRVHVQYAPPVRVVRLSVGNGCADALLSDFHAERNRVSNVLKQLRRAGVHRQSAAFG